MASLTTRFAQNSLRDTDAWQLVLEAEEELARILARFKIQVTHIITVSGGCHQRGHKSVAEGVLEVQGIAVLIFLVEKKNCKIIMKLDFVRVR
jgi:hypothetical protein